MASRLHEFTSERLPASCELRPNHYTFLCFEVVAHLVYVPLVYDVELLSLQVLEANVFEFGLVQVVEGEN